MSIPITLGGNGDMRWGSVIAGRIQGAKFTSISWNRFPVKTIAVCGGNHGSWEGLGKGEGPWKYPGGGSVTDSKLVRAPGVWGLDFWHLMRRK